MSNADLAADRLVLAKQGNRFEIWTMAWNLSGLIVLSLANSAHPSMAIIGMQMVALIHVFTSGVVLSQLNGIDRRRDHFFLKVIAIVYGVATLYLLAKAVIGLMISKHYSENYLGILWLGLTYFAMWTLSRKKRMIGHALQNQILIHVSDMNRIDAYIALAAATGLMLSAFCGFFWADPLAALIIVGYMCEEGIAAWRASVEHGAAFTEVR